MVNEEKIIDFLEKYAKFLYSGVEEVQKKLGINANSKYYQTFESFKNDTMEVPLNLFRMMKEEINNDIDIPALIYLIVPHYFIYKEDKNFMTEYFHLSFKRIKRHARYSKRKVAKKLGEDWFAKAYFPSEY